MKFGWRHTEVRKYISRMRGYNTAVYALIFLCVLLAPAGRCRAEELQAATMMEATQRANVHSEPDTGAQALGKLEPGDRVYAVELMKEGWYRIVYQGEAGYIKSEYLEVYGTDDWDAPETQQAAGLTGKVINPEEEFRKAEEKKQAATIKTRSTWVTIGAFAGAVLLIVGYGAYIIVKEKKGTGPSEKDGNDPKNTRGDKSGNGEMEFLDLG